MRSLLLCGALLALLAAPARANKWGPVQTSPPFKVVGRVLANNEGVGFDGKPLSWEADANDKYKVHIIANPDPFALPPATPAGWSLVGRAAAGSAVGDQSLKSVAWGYGAIVFSQLDAKNNLVAYLGPDPIKPGTRNLGPLVTITFVPNSCSKRGCTDRTLEITVRTQPWSPFIKISIIQPWLKPAAAGQKGAYADYLEVTVTLLQKPAVQPTGVLGDTWQLPLKDQLKAAKIIYDVINDVQPIPGLSMSAAFDGAGFENGAELAEADVASVPTLEIQGAKAGQKFVLFVVDPDAPDPKKPKYRSWLHGLWYNIPADGDLTQATAVLDTEWEPPTPPKGTHRYVFVLYKQPPNFKPFAPITVPTDAALAAKVLGKWNLNSVAYWKGLGVPRDVVWFVVKA